jgi:hypothetical protein
MLVQALLAGYSVRLLKDRNTYGFGYGYGSGFGDGYGDGSGFGRGKGGARIGSNGVRGLEENVFLKMGFGNGDGTGVGSGEGYGFIGCCSFLPVSNEVYSVGVDESC